MSLKNLLTFVTAATVLLMAGCSNANQGLPDELTFPENGGKTTLRTEGEIRRLDYFYIHGDISISDYGHGAGDTSDMDPQSSGNDQSDSIIIRREWLTLKARVGENKFMLIADGRKTENDVLEVYMNQSPWNSHSEATIKVRRAK